MMGDITLVELDGEWLTNEQAVEPADIHQQTVRETWRAYERWWRLNPRVFGNTTTGRGSARGHGTIRDRCPWRGTKQEAPEFEQLLPKVNSVEHRPIAIAIKCWGGLRGVGTALNSEDISGHRLERSLMEVRCSEGRWTWPWKSDDVPVNTVVRRDAAFHWVRFGAIVLFWDRPVRLCQDEQGRLHCDGGPAFRYEWGEEGWALHGVEMPKELVLTPDVEVDVRKWYDRLQNEEQRAALVNKVGLDLFAQRVGYDVLDREGDYELIVLAAPGHARARNFARERPFLTHLKMLNPSTGTYHIEGVPPDTTTVEEALAFRNGRGDRPVRLT
jgi:hypothetical protein